MSSRSLRRNRRAAAAGALAATLGFAGLGLAASPASAVPGFELERLDGLDRIETAVEISQDTFDAVDTVLLARADLFPDALAGNYLAGAEGAPILLSHTDEVPQETLDEIERLGATNVTLLGGTAALSEDVEAQLEDAGLTVDREAGTDRYKTAADIATSQDAATIGDTAEGRTAILATGERFPDALTGGPLAYAGSHPLLLTPTASLGEDAAGALETLEIEHVLILGGTAAVSQAAEDAVEAMGITTERLDGETRYDTATDIAEWAIANAGFSNTHVDVATGRNFPDALTGGPHAGENTSPIILANEGNTAEAEAFLTSIAATVAEGHIFGGTAAVSAAVEAALEDAGQTAVSNQTFTVTPDTLTTLTHNGSSEATSATDDRTYSVSGLDDTVTYRLALFPAENVTNTGGTISFADVGDDGLADGEGSAPEADIVKVNNATITAADEVTVNSVGGNLTFTIDGVATGTVTPVLYVDANLNTNLNLDADNEPTEAFGVGGATRYTPAEATGGAFGAAEVSLVDKTEDFFVAGGATYFYDSNDAYQIGGVPSTFANWEAALSSSDQVAGTYATDPDASSTFNLTNDNPGTPTGVAATQSGSAVSVAWTPSGDDVDSYNIYRALSGNGTDCAAATTPAAAYSVVGTDTASPFTDTSVTVPEQYCYSVTEVNDGDEGNRATPAFVSLTAVDAAAPTISMTYVSTDNGLTGDADATDVHRFIFSEPMNTTIDNAGSTYRVQDADGTVANFVCDTNATCDLHESAVTIGTTTYAGGRVMEVTIAAPAIVTPGTSVGVQYPVTITAVSAGWDDAAGNQLDLAGSADKTIESNTSASAVVNPVPSMASATDSADGPDTATITWSEGVTLAGAATDFTVVADGGACGDAAVANGTGATVTDDDGDTTLVVAFGGDIAAGDYELCAAAGAVNDADGQANAAQTVPVTFN